MRDALISAVRTAVQAAVGLLLAVPIVAGFDIPADALEQVLTAIAVGVVTLVLRWLENRLPWLTLILSLGTTSSTPAYQPKHLA